MVQRFDRTKKSFEEEEYGSRLFMFRLNVSLAIFCALCLIMVAWTYEGLPKIALIFLSFACNAVGIIQWRKARQLKRDWAVREVMES